MRMRMFPHEELRKYGMNTSENPNQTSPAPTEAPVDANYDVVPHLFLELRGRGQSLSSADIDVLASWQDRRIPVSLIVSVALEIADQCQAEQRPYPATLASIDRRLKKHLKRRQEI